MIKFILPANNIALLNELSQPILEDVCNLIFGRTDFTITHEDRRIGRYVKAIDEQTGEIHYICFSNPQNNSRNAHLLQFVSPTYVEYYDDKSDNKYLDIYLLNQSGNDRTDYIKMFYRCFATIGINILNIQGITDIVPFMSYDDLKSYRNLTSQRNTHNRSTYFTDDDNQISIYGKTFGANAMESFIFGLTIIQIASKQVVFYPVVDNESEDISRDQRRILSNAGISFSGVIELLPTGFARPTRDTSRNQGVFRYNLLQKFGDQQCYLCGNDLEHLIIASHIERVTDIDKNETYSTEQKAERSTDGDNGLWLCASHDKMFEYGIIYFENAVLNIRPFITSAQQQQFILDSIFEMRKIYFKINNETNTFTISNEHYTEKMHNYLIKHLERHSLLPI